VRFFRGLPRVVFQAGILIPLSLQADPLSKPEKLTPAESRGKIIYATGQSSSGRPLSYKLLSAGEASLPAKGVDCANCHGIDGRGGREGGVLIPDIRYATLTRPSTAPLFLGKQRAAYTDALLSRAITRGLDSSGQELGSLMPRWTLSESEQRDLLKYLKRLGRE
jgi:mono/diheme cytochrome c family protein